MFSDSGLSAAHQFLLRERLLAFLVPLPAPLSADVDAALRGKGKLLSTLTPDASLQAGVWPYLTLSVSLMISPGVDLEGACACALAMECFVCALDLLDDVEDGDRTPILREVGIPRALNTSTALLALTFLALQSVRNGELSNRLQQAITTALLTATSGQHRDLIAEQESFDDLTDEQCIDRCLEIASGKAGAIMALACRVGALVAGAGSDLVELCAEMGRLAGISFQLKNDCHDFTASLASLGHEEGPIKTDIERDKKTLPLVLARRLQKSATCADDKEQEAKLLNAGLGAAWAIRLLYTDYVREQVAKVEECQGSATPLLLLDLLDISTPLAPVTVDTRGQEMGAEE